MNTFLDIKLKKIQENSFKGFFTPCKRKCRDLLNTQASVLGFGGFIGVTIGVLTGSLLAAVLAKDIGYIIGFLVSQDGLFAKYCNLLCEFKNNEKLLRQAKKRNDVDTQDLIDALEGNKKDMKDLEEKIEKLLRKVKQKDGSKYSKLIELFDSIKESSDLYGGI